MFTQSLYKLTNKFNNTIYKSIKINKLIKRNIIYKPIQKYKGISLINLKNNLLKSYMLTNIGLINTQILSFCPYIIYNIYNVNIMNNIPNIYYSLYIIIIGKLFNYYIDTNKYNKYINIIPYIFVNTGFSCILSKYIILEPTLILSSITINSCLFAAIYFLQIIGTSNKELLYNILYSGLILIIMIEILGYSLDIKNEHLIKLIKITLINTSIITYSTFKFIIKDRKRWITNSINTYISLIGIIYIIYVYNNK